MGKTNKVRLTVRDDNGNHLQAAHVEVLGCDYEGADLSGLSYIAQKGLRGKCFRHSILYWANLSDSDFSGCDFRGADLRGAVLMGTNLSDCDFRGANLGNDQMGGETQIDGANFEGSIYDRSTVFPEGYSPKTAQMQYQENS
ncbi:MULTISPECIES: pentapeptide repeat-containing protein [unclassified Agarivorans]|uniref:pentapeptide repeat-containing protein n=1 Tax=unclassified Agarivorans TaxID=2636026 RepID=UPI0026E16D47|nr:MULTISPECIES: pentapeptide repeat-containing protein [unclassified Agarivorans]MDO6685395.1 pentapeptide repeat-containing protein [Agarivorans sp. 3_MG-2023]MDO6715781.1 pentapeptide repeat-containing protein [Agarivorans sp. 2_MG-2023]